MMKINDDEHIILVILRTYLDSIPFMSGNYEEEHLFQIHLIRNWLLTRLGSVHKSIKYTIYTCCSSDRAAKDHADVLSSTSSP